MSVHADIAVVIPCYNHANVLRRTLEGLCAQTLQPAEVIVVDDGSSDHPEQIVAGFSDKLPIRFLKQDTNRGAPVARNRGAAETKAPFLLFLDADAYLETDALESMATALLEHSDASFAYSDFFWGRRRFKAGPFDREALQCQNYIHTSSLIRRVDFPGFDETLQKFQDWDLWLTMARQGKRGIWIPRVLYRIEPRKEGLSRWLPRIAYRIPWQRIGFLPKEIRRYREAEAIVRKKHGI